MLHKWFSTCCVIWQIGYAWEKVILTSVKTIVTGSNKYLKPYHDQINHKLLRKDNQKLISFVIKNKHLLLLNQLYTHFKLIFKKKIFLY